MFINRLVAALIVTAVITSLLFVPALANDTEGPDSIGHQSWGYGYGYSYRPGWGYGDSNHTHIGPPGQVNKNEKPGWGKGDDNHDHAGPPGKLK